MLKVEQRLEVTRLMVQDKIMRRMVHHTQKFFALADDYLALAPSQASSPKSCDLNVLLLLVAMRNTDRIVLDKIWVVVLSYLGI